VKAGEASVTAQRVAAQRLTFERIRTPYGDPAADDALARDVAGGVGGAAGPLTRYLAARTAFFDRVVVDRIEDGCDQVVVLAAGYDGRSMRYAKAGVRWFEIDHPSTQQDKLDRVDRLGLSSSAVFASADFAVDDVAAVLDRAGQVVNRPTLFLCEGVAVYLDPSVFERLLESVRSRAGDGSRLAISLSVPGATAANRQTFQQRVASVGEPARNVLTPNGAAGVFERTGWQTVGSSDAADRVATAGFVLLEPAETSRNR
jgi:methyltransferase (TIGR00027 family)